MSVCKAELSINKDFVFFWCQFWSNLRLKSILHTKVEDDLVDFVFCM